MDFELEQAVVIGRRGMDIAVERALEHVFGYTIFNDLSARDVQALEMAAFPRIVMRAEPVRGEEKSILAEIQTVEEGYPLRGRIEVDDGAQHIASAIPAPGTIWADARLMRRLDLRVGDEVSIGALRLRLAARVVRDVDQAIGFASFAPRVLLNMSDLPATGLVQEGSRINYRLPLAGEAAQLAGLRMWLEKRLALGEKLEDVRDARPESARPWSVPSVSSAWPHSWQWCWRAWRLPWLRGVSSCATWIPAP